MGGAGKGGQLLLEKLDLRAHHILAMGQNPRDRRVDLRPQPRLLGGEIDKGDRRLNGGALDQ